MVALPIVYIIKYPAKKIILIIINAQYIVSFVSINIKIEEPTRAEHEQTNIGYKHSSMNLVK